MTGGAFVHPQARPGSRVPEPAHHRQHRVCSSKAHGGSAMPRNEDFDNSQFTQDWRTFRAQLVAQENQTTDAPSTSDPLKSGRWAHPISSPEVGCLLVARFEDMGIFSKTVVLLLAHDDAKGTLGVILNRPTPVQISKANGESSWMKEVFQEERLHIGGPIRFDCVNVIHGCAQIPEAKRIVEGVYHGGDFHENAGKLVEKGDLIPSEVRVLRGYAAWAEYQLAAELHDDAWWVLAASKGVILECSSGVSEEEYYNQYWENVLKLSGIKPKL